MVVKIWRRSRERNGEEAAEKPHGRTLRRLCRQLTPHEQNRQLRRLGNNEIADHLEFSRHMKTWRENLAALCNKPRNIVQGFSRIGVYKS